MVRQRADDVEVDACVTHSLQEHLRGLAERIVVGSSKRDPFAHRSPPLPRVSGEMVALDGGELNPGDRRSRSQPARVEPSRLSSRSGWLRLTGCWSTLCQKLDVWLAVANALKNRVTSDRDGPEASTMVA